MIPYSICARQNPQSQDTDIKFYANAQAVNHLDMVAFAKHIQSHGSVYSRADIQAVLTLAVDCIREQLLEGNKVSLGELGSFNVTFHSEGTRKAEDFSAANITSVNVNWTPGPMFKDLRKEAIFRKVPTRKAQALVVAAETKGENTVTLPPKVK